MFFLLDIPPETLTNLNYLLSGGKKQTASAFQIVSVLKVEGLQSVHNLLITRGCKDRLCTSEVKTTAAMRHI